MSLLGRVLKDGYVYQNTSSHENTKKGQNCPGILKNNSPCFWPELKLAPRNLIKLLHIELKLVSLIFWFESILVQWFMVIALVRI